MSEDNLKPPITDLTLIDLHIVQAEHGTILAQVRDDMCEIKEVLVGSDHREGIIMDVDRLKRSRKLFHAVLWVVFTATVGTSATLIAAAIMQ